MTIKDNTINNIVEPEPEAKIVNSSTGDNTDSSEEILIEKLMSEKATKTLNTQPVKKSIEY